MLNYILLISLGSFSIIGNNVAFGQNGFEDISKLFYNLTPDYMGGDIINKSSLNPVYNNTINKSESNSSLSLPQSKNGSIVFMN